MILVAALILYHRVTSGNRYRHSKMTHSGTRPLWTAPMTSDSVERWCGLILFLNSCQQNRDSLSLKIQISATMPDYAFIDR